jgi:hypothetical protein
MLTALDQESWADKHRPVTSIFKCDEERKTYCESCKYESVTRDELTTLQADPGWTEAHLLLRIFVAMGLHRLPDICDGNTIVLPTTISGEASSAYRRILNRVATSRGSLVRWVDMTPPKHVNLPGPRTPYLIRPGDTGQSLVGGHVRLKSKGVTKTGTITT